METDTLNISKCKDLDSCIEWVVELHGMQVEFLNWLGDDEDKALIGAHHGFGQWIRNTLELWYDGQMVPFFNKLGIYHADDMSSIILVSTHRKQNDKPINLEDQVKKHIDYWDKTEPKVNQGIME